jgi:hypothetical protein
MSPKRLVISTTYKTRVALDKPCKEYQGILIGQPKDSCALACGLSVTFGTGLA